MKSQTQKITVTLEKHEAHQIITCIRNGMKNLFQPEREEEYAAKFLHLLEGNFESSKAGVHFPKGD